jgi:hypothetical protein
MLSRDQTMDILLLHKQGHSIRRIDSCYLCRADVVGSLTILFVEQNTFAVKSLGAPGSI